MFATPTSAQNVCQRARAVYQERIRPLVEPQHVDKFIAIEPDTGEFAFDEDLSTASRKLKERRPDSQTCILRIGHKAAIRMGSGWPSGYKGTPIADTVKHNVFWGQCRDIYESEIRPWVEPKYNGQFLAMDPDTVDCEVHDELLGAVTALSQRLPGVPFYVLQIGRKDFVTGVITGQRAG